MDCKEIFKLKNMLDADGIPYEMQLLPPELFFGLGERTHVSVPTRGKKCVCSIIQGGGTYGAEDDLLEIMGLLTKAEQRIDNVVGSLTAENVMQRIRAHYSDNKKG